ncbi:MAG: patatin-like phospholipase family protein [Gammaproteobacteria bacterium]|nr:patatin-like phospholipase family protein [Gammaproteobacteria bacterium]MCW5583069.1 patatin-like phospholipase family protein [Gammaproteobacteria bacterium]
MSNKPHGYDKVVYLLQGGGALGTYQVGACEALLEYGCTPDWLVGTSIGAINAAIIAGNTPENRIKKLEEFWSMIASPWPAVELVEKNYMAEQLQKSWNVLWTLWVGQTGFFKPRLFNPWIGLSSFPDQLSFYDTSELRYTLEKLVDFDLINKKEVRLTLAAVCVEDGELVYFDNMTQEIGPEHVMASGALPPGFPAIRIAGKNYWDGGLSSNTPLTAIIKENMQEKLLCILMHLFSYHERTPANLLEILKLRKDIEFSSRYHQILTYICKVQHLHNLLHHLVDEVPDIRKIEGVDEIIKFSHPIIMNIVRFHYRDYPGNLWTKDFDFSRQTLMEHYQSGYQDVKQALKNPEWLYQIPEHGIELHEF